MDLIQEQAMMMTQPRPGVGGGGEGGYLNVIQRNPRAARAIPEHRAVHITECISTFWNILVLVSMQDARRHLAQWAAWEEVAFDLMIYFKWASDATSLLPTSSWGGSMFILFIVPMCWLMNTHGLRAGVLTCTLLVAVGTALRCLSAKTGLFTVMSHLCAILVGIAGTLVMAAPPLIAAEWFPPKERTTATAMAQAFNQFGNAGSYMEPLLVRSPEDASSSEIRSDIMRLMYIDAGFAAGLFLVVLIYFPTKPLSPPSVSSTHERLDFKESIKSMILNRDLLLVTLSYGVFLGVPGAWMSVMNFSLQILGIDQDEAMNIGILTIILSALSAMVSARFTDYLYGYVRGTIIILIFLTSAFFYWFFLLVWGSITVTTWQVYVTVVGSNALNFATAPLFFELAVESAYPCSEIMVGGFVTTANNITGLLFLLLFFINWSGYNWVTYVLLATSSLSALPLLFVSEGYSRSRIDRPNLSSPYQPI
ncbi:unnamed protein product, partial [Meganyctiphanes norvegica]